jgi:hypothetical protein
LCRLTGGNPFFVTEILAAGSDALRDGGLPRSVSEAVGGTQGPTVTVGRCPLAALLPLPTKYVAPQRHHR